MYQDCVTRIRPRLLASLLAAISIHALTGGAVQAQVLPSVRVTEITEISHPFITWHCARQPVQVRVIGSLMEVVLNGDSRILQQAISASGARYVAPDDPGTEFWGKGGQATLTWSGSALPTCVEAGQMMIPMRASGNEPFWSVDYDGFRMSLRQPGQPPRDFDVSGREPHAGGWVVQAESEGSFAHLDVSSGICIDNMSGQPRPYSVTLRMSDTALQGCGGDPARLLQGAPWQLKIMGGEAVNLPAIVEFLPDNRLTGTNGCNRLVGAYAISGEGLTISQLASTRMACDPNVMVKADEFDRYLSGVHGFSFTDPDELILKSEQGELQLQFIGGSAD